jgi:hypothetical protein
MIDPVALYHDARRRRARAVRVLVRRLLRAVTRPFRLGMRRVGVSGSARRFRLLQ